MNFLIQPKKYKSLMADEGSRAVMEKTIDFFENMGKTQLLDDYSKKVWYKEFVDFIGKEQIFAKLLTPKEYAAGDPDCRWDTARNCEYSELLAFYGHGYSLSLMEESYGDLSVLYTGMAGGKFTYLPV